MGVIVAIEDWWGRDFLHKTRDLDNRDGPKELGKRHGSNLIFYGLDLCGGILRARGLFRVGLCLSGLVTTKEASGLGSVGDDGGLFVCTTWPGHD